MEFQGAARCGCGVTSLYPQTSRQNCRKALQQILQSLLQTMLPHAPLKPPASIGNPMSSRRRLQTIRGHVFCSFLALVLKSELEERIAGLGRSGSWPEIIADLDSLTETEIAYDGKRFIVRSAPRPAASLALRAAGVALPPTVRNAAAS